VGISDDFLRELAANMEAGGSILFVLVRRATMDKFIDDLSRHGGQIIHPSLSRDAEHHHLPRPNSHYQQKIRDRLFPDLELTAGP